MLSQHRRAVHEVVDAERPAVGGLVLFHAVEGDLEIVFLRVLGQVCPEPGVEKSAGAEQGRLSFTMRKEAFSPFRCSQRAAQTFVSATGA